ncbi:unnamed protein product [Strongylus vulgaris]|uniref:Uncharacterized protein n=1 Tax=Strongylus vulgaris TaxID=40348 RepID=A0A3P7IZ25_STRVU|nr:unnamed protein product [Strongylus vulgaris]
MDDVSPNIEMAECEPAATSEVELTKKPDVVNPSSVILDGYPALSSNPEILVYPKFMRLVGCLIVVPCFPIQFMETSLTAIESQSVCGGS